VSKPYGLTGDFRVIRPTAVENHIWDAVQEAVLAGWTVEQFRREARQAWSQALDDTKREAERAWEPVP